MTAPAARPPAVLVVDEAYGQFAPWSATSLLDVDAYRPGGLVTPPPPLREMPETAVCSWIRTPSDSAAAS